MEKVWFRLRQTDYPPPTAESLGTQTDTGPITLGHFISSLRNIDFVLNRGAVKPFPLSMPVYKTEATSFEWEADKSRSVGVGAGAGAPIAAMAGVTLDASVQLAFERSVQNHEAYDKLDTYIVQPSRAYIEDCLDEAELAAYVKGKLAWSVFMISGIKVARKGRRADVEQRGHSVGGNVTLAVPEVANIDAHVNSETSSTQSMAKSGMSDFVWAIRLAKVSGGVLIKNWSLKPYTDRATFTDDENVDVRDMIKGEGLEKFALVQDQGRDEIIVLEVDG
ncbi:hypothetical protein SVAN01_11865 [Stagonosporopsis vannaccii]|nr:hypothetical protein SVAN01_11865 [Stagonosporopsis vannaccii]